MENPLINPLGNPPSSMKDMVLKQIEEGSVSVTPKWKFNATALFSGLGLVAGFLLMLFVITLIHFSLRESGILALPEFGGEGVREFLLSLPWVPIVFLLGAALALEFWLLRYAFAYRQPLLYSVFALAAVFTLGTVLVSAAKVHEGVYEVAEANNSPIVKPLYHSFIDPEPKKVRRGMVAELEEQGFLLRGRGGQVLSVTVTRETRIAPPVAVRVGDMVIVFGQQADGSFQAIGVKHVPATSRVHAPGM